MKMNNYVRHWENKNRKWIYEHRLVMENYLGRSLGSDEHVHHIDGNPKNNAIENLKVVDAHTHFFIHMPPLKNRFCSVKGCNGKHHGKGYCKKHYARMFRKDQGW